MIPPEPAPPHRAAAWQLLTAYALLAALIVGLHGTALRGGLFMDDYAHYKQLRESDWTLAGLAQACRLELVGGVIQLWWLPETTLRFFRPVAFGLMKLTYTLTGWSPVALHAASLGWHFAVCVLLMMLLRRCGATLWLAWAVAGLFALHPGQVATVQWIACQTELMVTALLLGATLCYGRFRAWPGFGTGAAGAAIGGGVLFALALGCRENAIVFPLVMATVDATLWWQRRRLRTGGDAPHPTAARGRSTCLVLSFYTVILAIIVVYLAVRGCILGGNSVPPRPYVIPPTAPDFVRFILDKTWYYLLGEFLLAPCVPIGGLPYLQARPLMFYGLTALVLALLLVVVLRCRREPAGVLAPAWLLGFMLPVLPVFVSPHHLYLPAVGWALVVMLILRGLGAVHSEPDASAARRRRRVMWITVALVGTAFGTATFYFGLAIETGVGVEDCLTEELAAAPSGLHDGDTLYIANLPVLGHYVRLALEQHTGRRGLRVIPLTWSPRLLGPATPTELIWIDDRTIEIRVADDRYFAGPLGLLVREATGRDVPDEVDRLADLGFRVRVLERDVGGIAALRFEFSRSLGAPGVHLFWGSRTRWACEVRP